MSKKYHFYTITKLSELVREQKVSPVELAQECLEQIEKWQPKVNAFITITADQALADAKQAEAEIKAGKWRGPLHGIPVAIKDMYDTAGVRTTAAFKPFKDRVPKNDAACVAKLKEAGAIIMGKTNLHELAAGTTSLISFFGPVHNPWNPDYIAGGSGGGSAAAVATGMCFATIDTDAVGSCRLPAACCSVVGYKCTWGFLDNSGILEGERGAPKVILTLATLAVTTRDASDTALVIDCLKEGSDFNHAMQAPPTQKRIGVVTNYGHTAPVRDNFNQAVEVFKKLGYDLTEIEAPIEERPNMKIVDESRKTANDVLFKDIDFMILPTTAVTVPLATEMGKNPQGLVPHNTFFANYFALPAVTVPSGFDENGLPMGLQIVGKQNDDAAMLRVALEYQSATDWHTKHP